MGELAPGWTPGYYLLAMQIMFCAFVLARGMMADKFDGAITRILAGPVTDLNYLVQNVLACMVWLTAQITAVAVLGIALRGWSVAVAVWLMLCYTVLAFAFVSFSFAWSCLFKSKNASFAAFSTISMFIAMLGGFMFPIELMPDILRYIGMAFPTYWASNAITILHDTGANAEYWLSLSAMILFAGAYLLYGGKRRII